MGLLEQIAVDARAVFYRGDFSESVAFTRANQTAAVSALVDLTYQEVDMEGDLVIQSTKPRISLWAADVPWPVKSGDGQTVTARGVAYTIRDVERQGDGGIVVKLTTK